MSRAASLTGRRRSGCSQCKCRHPYASLPLPPTQKRGGASVEANRFAIDRSEDQPGTFAVVVNAVPGTHHIRFLIDGDTCTSPDLPTAVDYFNNLVNYIEVRSPDESRSTKSSRSTDRVEEEQKRAHKSQSADSKSAQQTMPARPAKDFSNEVPAYLADFDQNEDTPQYQSAVAAFDKLPNPPALPGFLGKPILNSSVLVKDDNSVLNMPNHTVLNHLATSSIKNGMLAVSATTRYRSKVSGPAGPGIYFAALSQHSRFDRPLTFG